MEKSEEAERELAEPIERIAEAQELLPHLNRANLALYE